VAAPVKPTNPIVALGGPVPVAALHINCASPNGNVDVVVSPGDATFTLLDDGTGGDLEAGDGIYTGEWTPSAPGSHTLTFTGGATLTVQVLSEYAASATTFNYRKFKAKEMNNLDLGDDDFGSIDSPFPILFGGGSFSSLQVSANGHISFDPPLPFDDPSDPFNDRLPTVHRNTMVAPFWDDLLPIKGTRRNVLWKRQGKAPNRELVIEWRGVRHSWCLPEDTTPRVRFQVVFFENSSDILFNYLDTTFGGLGTCSFASDGRSATVGIQITPETATQLGFEEPSVSDGTAILWQVVWPPPAPASAARESKSK
jgi:hypothetical protein